MLKFFKRLASWFGWLLLGCVVIVAAFVMVTTHDGWQFAAVLSGSMRPKFQVGGLVVIKPVDASTLQVGEIISFMKPSISKNTAVCHRILAIQYQNGQEFFQTKGDANNAPDQGLTPTSFVKGKEILYIPDLGRIADAKNFGATHVSLMGMSLPIAVLVIGCLGLLLIVLTLKDAIESILHPGRQWQKDMIKKRNEKNAKRRKIFNL